VAIRVSFLLVLAALTRGVLRDAVLPRSWRRTVRAEFWRTLRQAAAGGLATALFAAALTGLGLVSQALYWFGLAGQKELVGSVLAIILIRQLTPLLVGLVLLGRSGTVAVTELGRLRLEGQLLVLDAQGLDPVLLLVVPRTVAFALASFSLAVFFVGATLVVGFLAGIWIGNVQGSLWAFVDDVLAAMRPVDFGIFLTETLTMGALVATTSCLTGLRARAGEDPSRRLPLGFNRGVIVVMLTTLVFSLAG
jgi:phospholipid/cholesterol/gamma-HCH transport system permease protein